MGCSQSTIGQESVSRCKERRLLMKQSVVAGAAFSTAHSAYSAALMSTGLSLRRYAHVAETPGNSTITMPELPSSKHGVSKIGSNGFISSPVNVRESKSKRSVSKMDSVSIAKDSGVLKGSVIVGKPKQKRSVSELYSFSMSKNNVVSLKSLKSRETKQKRRVLKLDHVPVKRNDDGPEETVRPWDFFINTPEPKINDDDDEDEDEDEELEFRTPDNLSRMEVSDDEEEADTSLLRHSMHSKTASEETRKGSNVNRFKALKEIADQFIKASDCAQDVSRLLKPNQYRFHHSFPNPRVTVDYAAAVMHVITWNPAGDAVNKKDDVNAKENEPLAVLLDKLLEWEKRLYVEVKASELMKLEYQRKVVLLAKHKRQGASLELLMKTKAAVRHLRARYRAGMQLIDSMVSEINNLRDLQLYPKLIELVDALANMWENMSTRHDNQLRMATTLEYLDTSAVPRETTWEQYERTTKLLSVIQEWQIQFKKLVANQKRYVNTLNIWLKLNMIPIRSNLKEKLSSYPRIPNPPIQSLLFSWHEYIEKLPSEHVNTAISSFVATIKTIILLQEEDMKLKEKCEETRSEYLRKNRAFEEWLHKHNKLSAQVDTEDENGPAVDNDLISERRSIVESLKKRLDEEMEVHRKHNLRVQGKLSRSLKTSLPELFRVMSDYGYACADAYNRLMCIALSENLADVNGDSS